MNGVLLQTSTWKTIALVETGYGRMTVFMGWFVCLFPNTTEKNSWHWGNAERPICIGTAFLIGSICFSFETLTC